MKQFTNSSKMRPFYFLGFLLCISIGQATGQEIQWADKVVEFSSELTPTQYSAKQATGLPDVFPIPGENPNAWTPSKANRIEYIKVGFSKPQKIQQIMIAESYNPTAVSEVFVYDKDGKEYLVNSFDPRFIDLPGRPLNVFFDMTPYEVHAVKVVLDGREIPGFHSIDAIGISASNIPITIAVKVSPDIGTGILPERLSENVNSEYTEYRPLLSPDGNTLFFSRKNHPENQGGAKDSEDIWFSEKDPATGEWKKAKNVGGTLNTKGPNFISSITPDGNTMILLLGNEYGKNGKMKAGVSMSRKEGDTWTEPETLEIENDYNLSEMANFFMANNQKVMLMSVERQDSEGDRDIYVSFLQPSGKWSEPKSLGTNVNTAHEESAPFLAADDKTLYFSSKGFSGYGGNDVYVTKRLDDTWQNWSEPQNLGPEINSPLDDEFFNIPPTGDYAYYSRGVTENNLDIFAIALPSFYKPDPVVLVKGRLLNSETGAPIRAKVVYQRLPDGEIIGETMTDSLTGRYEIVLPTGTNYAYLAEADGYVAISEHLDLTDQKEYLEVDQKLELAPVEVGVTIVMNNIFFDFNKAILKKESFPELERIQKFLAENDHVEIEIAGHTDNIGTESVNKALSHKRANAVHRYLVSKGISKSRLKTAGYGESAPVATNDTVEGRQENRRAEFKITHE